MTGPSSPLTASLASHCSGAAKYALHAADYKFRRKREKHGEAYEREKADFVPIVLESTGAFHPRSLLITKSGGHLIGENHMIII